jgi:hypothetical protein
MSEMKVDSVVQVAQAIRADVRKVLDWKEGIVPVAAWNGKVVVKDESGLAYKVDYSKDIYSVGQSGLWKKLKLTEWTIEETQDEVRSALRVATRNIGANPAVRQALLQGTERTLGIVVNRLSMEGTGAVAALHMDDILSNAVDAAIREAQFDLENSSWSSSILHAAWTRIAAACVRAIYGTEYGRRVRRERWEHHAKVGSFYGSIATGLGFLANLAFRFA